MLVSAIGKLNSTNANHKSAFKGENNNNDKCKPHLVDNKVQKDKKHFLKTKKLDVIA